jgi:2-polyprenyl-3-methyl-5-hydroxy-6-metoxy-1,4-benzoquinol methylase
MNNRFDKDAASWDAKEYRIRLAGSVASAIRREVKLDTYMDLLDFGCGTGLVSLSLAGEVASLTGVDNSAGMLEVFREKASGMNLPNVHSLHLNLSEGDVLPFAYDLILSGMALHHVKDVTGLIRILFHALKPGGHLCIADLDPDQGLFHSDNTDIHHFGFERKMMMEFFRDAGFSQIRVSTAASLPRTGVDGIEREFSIFLVTGEKLK